MAADDVISDWEVTVSASSRVSIQPSAGVEWLITKMVEDNGTTNKVRLSSQTTDDSLYAALRSGETAAFVTSLELAYHFGFSERFMVNNGNYFRVYNSSSPDVVIGYSGIQTK